MEEFINDYKKYLDDYLQLFTLDKLESALIEDIDFGQLMGDYDLCTEISKKKEYILRKVSQKIAASRNRLHLFNKFIYILLHTNQDALAGRLYPKCIDMIDFDNFDPAKGIYYKEFSFGRFAENDKIERIDQGIVSSNSYEMNKSFRGYCLLINNYFTPGTFMEMQRFRNIFYQLHFEVKMKKNLDRNGILRVVTKYSSKTTLTEHNAFVMMIITHGNDNKEILGFDGKTIKLETLIEYFNNANCPNLQNKPRMFFMNCCRGDKADSCVPISFTHRLSPESTETSSLSNTFIYLPSLTDFIICYSTLDGFVAQVNWMTGTHFGNALANSFTKFAGNNELNVILTDANAVLIPQASGFNLIRPFEWTQTGIRKKIIFFPHIPKILPFESK